MHNWRARRLRGRGLDPWATRIQRGAVRAHMADRADTRMVVDRRSGQLDVDDGEYIRPRWSKFTPRVSVAEDPSMINGSNTESLTATTTECPRPSKELQDLVDFVPQVLVELEADGRWIHVNRVACEYTGLTLDEYKSVDVGKRVIHPDDIQRMRSTRIRGFTGTTDFEFEVGCLGKTLDIAGSCFVTDPQWKRGGSRDGTEAPRRSKRESRKKNV